MNSCQKSEVELGKTRQDDLPENVTRAPNGDYIVTLTNTRSGATSRYIVPQELQYTDTHEWIHVLHYDPIGGGMVCEFGLTDFAVNCGMLGTLVYLDMHTDTPTYAGQAFANIEGTATVSDLLAPFDGVVSEVNQAVWEDPATLHDDPYNYLCILVEINIPGHQDRVDFMDYSAYEYLIRNGWGVMSAEEYVRYLLE